MQTEDRPQSSSPEPSQGSPTALSQWEKQEAGGWETETASSYS